MQNLSRRTQNALPAILIATVALLPRIFGLNVFLTADEPKSWFGRSIQFLDALARADLAATFDSPAPGVTTMWAGSIGLLLEYARQGFPGSLTAFLAAVPFDPLDPAILPLIRLPGVLIATLTVVLTYSWGRHVVGRAAALLTALLLALDPFLLALTRILGHDGLVTLFMWLSLVAFLRAKESNQFNRKFVIISGAMGGLAFLTKYPSLFLGAFIALIMLVFHRRWRRLWSPMLRNWVIDVSIWSTTAGLIFVLLWPAMWVDPIGQMVAIFNDALRASGSPHPKGSFFFGQPVPDPGPSYYLIITLFRTTPILWLGWLLALAGLIVEWRRGRAKNHWVQTALTLLAFSLLFGLLVTVGGKKQDRYILPIFPALVALAALGYTKLQLALNKRKQLTNSSPFPPSTISTIPVNSADPPIRNRMVWLILIVVIVQAAFVLATYPYYFTFYTPLLGGGNSASRAIIVGWGEGLDQAAAWLNKQENASGVEVVAWYSTTFEPFFDGHAIYKIEEEKISRTPKPGLAADYVVLYVNQVQRELPTPGALQFFRAVPPAHTVTLNGTDYAWIYPSVKMQHVLGNEARLVGQAELLGYNLLDEQKRPISELPADSTALIQLYWEWQGKAPDEPIGLNFVDRDGRVWGQVEALGSYSPIAFEEWLEGAIARTDFVLHPFPGIPPGDYYLKAWIDRPASGERVGDFPLLLEDTHIVVTRPTAPPALANLPLSAQLDTTMADGITLLGLSNHEQMVKPWWPGESRDLVLYWQTTQSIDQNHPLTLALVDADGASRTDWINLPAGGHFPTDRWQANDTIRDPWSLTLPPYVPPGDYRLTVRLGKGSPANLLTVPVEGRSRLFDLPKLDMRLNATFDHTIKLLGLQTAAISQSAIEITPGQPLTLALVWQATELVDTDYTVSVQLLDAQQNVQAQQDRMPLDGAAPTTSWATGEVLADRISLDIPSEVGPGPYNLLVALYHFNTGERLPVSAGTDHLRIPARLQ
jgi:4-amino-4-deoxy-L-arabinose transferase-like glycosyltransferase